MKNAPRSAENRSAAFPACPGPVWFALVTVLLLFSVSPLAAQPSPATGEEKEDVLAYADLLFSQKQYALAARQYQIFVRDFPDSRNIQSAWFRLGECYHNVGQDDDATTTFNYVINQFKTGPFAGAAAYRLAVVRFNANDYRNALAYFQIAAEEMTNPSAKLQARFYYARSLQLTQQAEKALAQYELVMRAGDDPETNPYYERCLLETARLNFDLGDTDKALERFEILAEEAKTKEFREEALVRGGLLAAEAGKPEVSEKFLDQALRFSDTSPWKSLAQVGAIFNAFSREDYDKVIGIYNAGAYDAPEESRPKMLLVVGHAFRLKDDLESAVRLYSLVEGKYGDRPEGAEAGYRKLQILHQQGNEVLGEAARHYIEKQRAMDPTSSFIDMAHLMKAEWHFNKAETAAGGAGSEYAKRNYQSAAESYAQVRDANVEERFHEIRVYKQGWSEVESGRYREGIQTLSRFIQDYPESDLAPSALAKRALAHQNLNDHPLALEDFITIVEGYPEAQELEYAMQQVALIQAHLRMVTEMIASYEALLERFPETRGAAEAHYWIGVGRFDQEEYAEAIPHLEAAREGDKDAYDERATLRLALAHYQLENIESLAVEARHYLESAPEEEDEESGRTAIPPPILEYLGQKLAGEERFEDAEFFLTRRSTPDDPGATAPAIWKLLAECRVAVNKYRGAVTAYDYLLLQTERPSDRAAAYLARGKVQLELEDYESARESARESLRSQKEGRTNAEARILMGDVAAGEGDLEEAAREYLVVSQIFSDPNVTPRALEKAANAYLALGNPEQAARLRQQLQQAFPNYTPAESE